MLTKLRAWHMVRARPAIAVQCGPPRPSSETQVLPEYALLLVLWCAHHFPTWWEQPGGPWKGVRGWKRSQKWKNHTGEEKGSEREAWGGDKHPHFTERHHLCIQPTMALRVGGIHPPKYPRIYKWSYLRVLFFFKWRIYLHKVEWTDLKCQVNEFWHTHQCSHQPAQAELFFMYWPKSIPHIAWEHPLWTHGPFPTAWGAWGNPQGAEQKWLPAV